MSRLSQEDADAYGHQTTQAAGAESVALLRKQRLDAEADGKPYLTGAQREMMRNRRTSRRAARAHIRYCRRREG